MQQTQLFLKSPKTATSAGIAKNESVLECFVIPAFLNKKFATTNILEYVLYKAAHSYGASCLDFNLMPPDWFF